MKAIRLLILALTCGVAQGAWAADYTVKNDGELRAAIANDGANITVTADIDLSNSTLEIKANTTVTLNLGGHSLNRGLTKRGDGGGQVITVRSGAKLNLSNGTLTGGWGGAGGALVNEGGTVTLTDVTCSNNVADDRGGGICNREGGTLTMTGGVITDNSSNDNSGAKGGGGFFNEVNATATLTGVTITGNVAKLCGGGGICNFGTLTVDGCTIQDNSANTSGGGIWQEGTLNMKGANTITGNTDAGGKANNVYLKNGKVITVTGSLAGSSIGITMETAGTFTNGYNTHNSSIDPTTIFTPDLSGVMAVSPDDNNEAQLTNALPEGTVYYIERSWDEENKCVKAEVKTLASGEYTTLTGGDDITLQPGYYVVNGNIERDDIILAGDGVHHLILCDGAQVEADFVHVAPGQTLHIYGQAANSGKLYIPYGLDDVFENHAAIGGGEDQSPGTIIIHGGDIFAQGVGGAGIGGGWDGDGGTVIIYGGNIDAQGGGGAAGIGGGCWRSGGTLTVYGGTVKAKGHNTNGGAGIGSGCNSSADPPVARRPHRHRRARTAMYPVHGGTVTIYGGYVEAAGGEHAAGIGGGDDGCGGKVSIHGGVVKAYGKENGAGIGTGEKEDEHLNNTGELTVTGGEVYAYGSDDYGDFEAPGGGAGIGGGRDADGSKVTISGGYVYAKGGNFAAGIGSGCEYIWSGGKRGGTVTITGGTVYAYGGEDAAGIGGGEDADGGTVIISGGYVYAEGSYGGAGIGGGEEGDGANVTITGGTVIAKAGSGESSCSAIGSGYDCDVNGSLTLGDDRCVYITNNLYRCKKENRVSDCWGAKYLQISECLHGGATASVVNGEKHDLSNCKWCYTTGEDTHYYGDDSQCGACGLIRLADEGDNSALFTKWADGDTHDFLLNRQKLVPNEEGSSRAYTVCLPFDMDLTGRDDLTVWTLSYIKDGSEMVFTQTSKQIEAGKPYLIVMHQGELELLGHSKLITTASEGVRVYDWENREQPLGWWRGTLTKIESADAAAMMAYALQSVGDFRRIRPDTPYAWWGAFRSMYCPDELPGTNRFTINKGAFGGFGGNTPDITFEGDADIEDATEIGHTEITEITERAGAWYTVNGVKLSGKPTMKGIYVNNGRKVVVK